MAFWIPPPSFSRCVAHANRSRPYPWVKHLNTKSRARRVLTALEVPVPGDFRVLGTVAEITPTMLDRPTAVKPDHGADNRGFLALVPDGRDRWLDVAHDVRLDFDGVRAALARELVGRGLEDRWIGEELLRAPDGGLPDDIKLLTFRGRPGVQFIRTNSPKRFRWFDPEWNEIDAGLAEHHLDPSIAPPADIGDFVDLALHISRLIPLPHIRVDLLATDRGPVVGELTPYPGWAHRIGPELDARLGELYERAEAELVRQGMDWGRVGVDDRLLPFVTGHRPDRAIR